MRSVTDVGGVEQTADIAADPEPPRTHGRFHRRSGRGLPRRLWLIIVLQALLMLCTTVLYPAFQNPDEAAHVDYVLAHRDGQWLDAPGTLHYQSGVLKAKQEVPDTQFREHVGASLPTERSTRLSFDELGTARPTTPFPNQMTQHPPMYYGLAAGFSYLLPYFDHHRFDIQVFWLRLLSVLLLLPVPLLIFTTARRVTGSQTVGLLASALPLAIPSYLRVGASVSNDSLLMLLTTVTVALLVRVAFGDLSRRTAVLIGLAWGGALLTKGFALSMPPAIVVAYLVAARGPLRRRIAVGWKPAVLAGLIGSAIGGWWWVRNLVEYHAVQPDGLGPLPPNLRRLILGADRPGGTEFGFFRNFVRLLSERTFGSIGLIDMPSLPVPLLVVLGTSLFLLLVASVLIGVGPLRRRVPGLRDSQWTAGRSLALLLPAILTILVMYAGARRVYLHGRQLPGIQVRYVLPTVLGLMICAAVVLRFLAGRFARWLPPLLMTLSLGFVSLWTYWVLDVEMSASDPDRLERLHQGLRFVVGWSPLPAYGSVILIAVTGLVGLLTLVVFWAGAGSDSRVEAVTSPEGPRSAELSASAAR